MADTNYVRFLRGTPEQYASATKNNDTLYFIIAEGQETEKVGSLYLGDVLLAGNLNADKNSVIDTLAELTDVNLEGIADNKVLGYNAETQKWIPMTIAEAMGSSIIKSTQVFETTIEKDADHNEAITTAVGDKDLQAGDIAIVKEAIADGKYEYTSYVYNGEAWAAMDGNYSAKNVFTNAKITTTTAVGNYAKNTAIEAGTSLESIISGLFQKEAYPTNVTQPSATISVNGGSGEVGTTFSLPTAKLTVNTGSYPYGPSPTGVKFEAGQVTLTQSGTDPVNTTSNTGALTNNGSISLAATGTNTTYGDTAVTFTFTGTASHTDGSTPLTNLNNPYESTKITAKACNVASKTASFTGWYNNWYYIGDELDEIDSAWVRAHATPVANNGSLNKTYDIAAGKKRVMFAYQGTHSITECIDVKGMSLDVKENFTTKTVNIKGANDKGGKDYTVFIFDNANGIAETQYKITFA